MSDEHPTQTVIWGIEVQRSKRGSLWPDEIRRMAVEKVQSGASVKAVSQELGTAPSVVHSWVATKRSTNAEQSFVEFVVAPDARPPKQSAAIEKPLSAACAPTQNVCVVTLGDISISVPPDCLGQHFAQILKAVRASL
ncbi:hypothetical protein [Frigidibacter sp. MR17.24]|uniref:hypothetical protein n=1 Tax=Frigidibacter sp. MR17.24 TaxID=3127345 RepID=UPI003012BD9B